MKVKKGINRRDFLQFMGQGAVAAGLSGPAFSLLQSCGAMRAKPGEKILPGKPFPSLSYSSEDALRLADGLKFKRIATWGEELSPGIEFGYNNDFLAFFPLGDDKKEGLLCVNHETPHSLFVGGYSGKEEPRTRARTKKEMDATGVSIVHIRESKTGEWNVVKGSRYNRKVSGRTRIPFVSERPIEKARSALGTLGNCAGGITPWGTYLTCEENYNLFYGEHFYSEDGKRTFKGVDYYDWYKVYPRPPEHYGWVVEIDPRTAKAKKLTALGRFAHEAATTVRAKDGTPVVYMGDDATDEHFYKFISDSKNSLEKGRLFVADIKKGKWLPLSWKDSNELRARFRDQTEVLIRAREAAKIMGATPLNRPEDVEICPRTGAIYVACTNNYKRKDPFGSIMKVVEKDNDYLSMEFEATTFLAGGSESGFACPDNMEFDRNGNLWVTCDISGSSMNKGEYATFGNNGLFYIPMTGENAGKAFLVATAPTDAEFTGPRFSPDGRTLFLSVQHPGEESRSLTELTSHWPEGGNSIPRPAVVAISGPLLDTILGA